MAVLPDRIDDRIQWFENRITGWSANASQIGLTSQQCAALSSAIVAARKAFAAAEVARIASKNATLTQKTAYTIMSDLGADALKFIKAYAESQPTPDTVYSLASVPPPAAPSPAGPPAAPTNVVADPNADGTITVKWKGSTANQTFFTIWRKAGTGTWSQIGSTASKKFIDAQVPGGVSSVRYMLRAQRGTTLSPASEEVIVNFGQATQAQAA
jgi:hypothetical protein